MTTEGALIGSASALQCRASRYLNLFETNLSASLLPEAQTHSAAAQTYSCPLLFLCLYPRVDRAYYLKNVIPPIRNRRYIPGLC
jgi:hypothetical protein